MDLSRSLNLPAFLLRTLGDSRFRMPISPGAGDVSSDGRTIAVCSNHRLWMLDAQSGDVRASVPLASLWSNGMSFSCDDARIFVATNDRTLVLDAGTLDVVEKVPVESGYTGRIVPCPVDARRLVVCSTQSSPRLVVLSGDAARVSSLGTPQKPLAPVRDVQWTTDGRGVIVWDGDGFHRFDGETGEHLARLNVDVARLATATLVAEGTALLRIDFHGTGSLCALDSGRVEILDGNVGWGAQAFAAPRGHRALVVSREGLHVLDVRGRKWTGPVPMHAASAIKGIEYSLHARVTRDESAAVIFDSRGALHHVDMDPLAVTERPPAGTANAIVFERDGQHLQVFRYQSPIERLALEGGAIERYGYVGSYNATVAFDRTHVRVKNGSEDTEVDLDARRQSALRGEVAQVRALVGDVEVGAGVHDLRFGRDGASIEAPELKKRRAVTVAPDGTRAFVLLQGGGVLVFDLVGRALVAQWKHPGACALHAVTADELVVGSSRGYVAWVDALTGKVHTKSGRIGEPRAIAVRDDGGVVAVSSGVQWLNVVGRDRPEAVVCFEGGEHLSALAFDAQGKLLAAGGVESVVRVFDVEAALATRPPAKPPKVKKAPRKKG